MVVVVVRFSCSETETRFSSALQTSDLAACGCTITGGACCKDLISSSLYGREEKNYQQHHKAGSQMARGERREGLKAKVDLMWPARSRLSAGIACCVG